MKRTYIYDPENPRREGVLSLLCEDVRAEGERRVITVAEPTRNLESNALMWVLLGDLSRQVVWTVDGKQQHLTAEEWKDIMTAGLRKEQRVASGIEGGFVILGARTSKMTQREMGELIELIYAFGAEQSVKWTEQKAPNRVW